jgi:hypothetical protein
MIKAPAENNTIKTKRILKKKFIDMKRIKISFYLYIILCMNNGAVTLIIKAGKISASRTA